MNKEELKEVLGMNDFDAALNESFLLNGTKLKCVKYDDNNCAGCFFDNVEAYDCEVKCQSHDRIDRENVMFIINNQ